MTELKEIKIHINNEDFEPSPKEEKCKIETYPYSKPKYRHNFYPRSEPHTPTSKWNLGCFYLDKECIVYFVQMIVLGACISISLWKVSTTTDNRDLWISLLSSCIGVIIPNPKLKNGPL